MPHALRARLAYDGPLLGAVSRIFVDSVLGWYCRRMELEGAVAGRSGAVTVVQRTSADLKLNPHLHSVLLDGVFVAGPDGRDGKPVFHALPRISDTAVADLLQIIRTRVMRFLVRRRVVEPDPDADTMLLPGQCFQVSTPVSSLNMSTLMYEMGVQGLVNGTASWTGTVYVDDITFQ